MNDDAKVPTNGANATAEGAALVLLQLIANSEGKLFTQHNSGADRQWILDTYGECLRAVRSVRGSGNEAS